MGSMAASGERRPTARKERACLPSPRASKNERGTLRRLLPVAITICLGVGASVATFMTVQTWEHAQLRATFENAAQDQAAVVGHIIQHDLLVLKLLERSYAGSEKVERDQFHEFTKPIPEDVRCLQALEWVPRVTAAQRAAYEEGVYREGLTGFQITEGGADGRMVRAGPREEYFPVHFAEPLAGNEQALGFDLGSEPTRRAALVAARDSGEMRGTGRIRLVQETGDQWGFLVLVPVYRNGASLETVEARRANLAGFVLGVFRLGDLLDWATGQLGPRGIDVALYDASSPAGERLLAWRGSRMRNEPAPPPPDADLPTLRGMHHAATFHPAGRTWVLVCTPCPEFLATAKVADSWGLLVGGLAFTALLAAYFAVTGRRAAEVERLADRLLVGNEQLEAQVLERKRAEQALEDANRRLAELATTDDLTGLANRRRFMELLADEFQRSRRYGGGLALVMVDVDHFKAFNDTYGHAFGDRVLVEVAKRLGAEARQTDVVARLGGDEFVILMPETSADEALRAAERIRQIISRHPVSEGEQSALATVSVGIATVADGKAGTPENLLKQADDAMYAAKEAGRNCVRVAGPKAVCQSP